MEKNSRNKLFEKVLELVDDGDLENFSLGMFTEKNASNLLEILNKSESPKNDLFKMVMFEEIKDFEIIEEAPLKNKPFEFFDITSEPYSLSNISNVSNNTAKCIGYLHDLIGRFRSGEAITMTSVALLKDGKSSIWIPNGFNHEKIDKIFDPVIKELKDSEPILQVN